MTELSPERRERTTLECKITRMRGTLTVIALDWASNYRPFLYKTLNSRINIIETRADSNIVQTDGKCALEVNQEGLEFIRQLCLQ